MKFSHKWLQKYIKETLPNPDVIEDALNRKAFEVEGIEEIELDGEIDHVYDIKVLPNRAHDALSHEFMARELCAILTNDRDNNVKFNFLNLEDSQASLNLLEGIETNLNLTKPEIVIEDLNACSFFAAVRVTGIKVWEGDTDIKRDLAAIGEKNINNIVDITNHVQFSINKPMHAYDARYIKGAIHVRYARLGEKLLTLDDRELELDDKTLVIADEEKVLGLAGIKGGKYSGIKDDTTEIIIESANFNSSLIRKTAAKYNIKTDASKRFENGISDTLVLRGIYETVKKIAIDTQNKQIQISEISCLCNRETKTFLSGFSLREVNSLLGSSMSNQEIDDVLNRLGFKFTKIIPKQKISSLIDITLNKPYNRLASTLYDAPNSFSCGSLVNWFYVKCGVASPRIAFDMYLFSNHKDIKDLKYGDLIFINTGVQIEKKDMIFSQVLNREIKDSPVYKSSVEFIRGTKIDYIPEGIDHVGMYIGDNKVLHASSLNGSVLIEDIGDSKYFSSKDKWCGSILNDLDEERYVVEIPNERLDLRIKEDLIEEVGRIYGFEKLKPVLPDITANRINKNNLNKRLAYANVVRNILLSHGFNEVITYSFRQNGDIKLAKAASDKNKMRTNLTEGVSECIIKNVMNAPLLNVSEMRVFEFGDCFTNDREWMSLAIGIDDGKKKSNFNDNVDMILSEIKKALGNVNIEYNKTQSKPLVVEINFTDLVESLEEMSVNVFVDNKFIKNNVKYTPFSQMPFIVRDVAFWCDLDTDKDEILNLIKSNSGDLCISVNLFDEFDKEIDGVKRKSLGYRLIYQASDRTLTDEEVNQYADIVYKKLIERGYTIR